MFPSKLSMFILEVNDFLDSFNPSNFKSRPNLALIIPWSLHVEKEIQREQSFNKIERVFMDPKAVSIQLKHTFWNILETQDTDNKSLVRDEN